ncbi:MAG: methylaspartate mutase accessory protein GlmL [Acidobacteria bacterium]|jgi:uncharacterized protein (TIGR01319 family)|nr:methylaspartate mutase accessory protein GlmL [Acidobacteriota bacterium]
MNLTLAIDFGSTYTKLVAFDLENEEIIGTAQAATTVDIDITIGLRSALSHLEKIIKNKYQTFKIQKMISSSSAAGGLRMVGVGLTKTLTTKAAQDAALGAGSKLIDVFSFLLTPEDINIIEKKKPDLILLAGGIDGGNEENIIKNARSLALSRIESPIIIAGNKFAAPKAQAILEKKGKYTAIVENILPELDRLNIEPARNIIRKIFIDRIIYAKGLEKVQEMTNNIIIPTPMAVLKGAALLSNGCDNEPGWGDLLVIDIGGATTDVYSMGYGFPTHGDIILKGLAESWDKRTVEGDLGIRCNASTVLERIKDKQTGITDDMVSYIHHISTHVEKVPNNEKEDQFDTKLAAMAVETAVRRHAGKIEECYLPSGKLKVQFGKDLTNYKYLIGVGGIFSYGKFPYQILKSACFDPSCPEFLCPIAPNFFIDKSYILFAAGLLSETTPLKAFRIMKKYIMRLNNF